MLKVKALMPMSVKPSFSTPSTAAPINAADDRAGAAGQRRAANHAGRHREEHDLVAARLRIDRADTERLEAAGEPRQHRSQNEIADLQARDVNAGLARAGLVGAGGDGVQPPARMAQHHVQHDNDQEYGPEDLAVAPGAASPARTSRRLVVSPACRAKSSG